MLFNNKIISVISDERNGNFDVFCNIRSFSNPDSIVNGVNQIGNNIPKDYKLYQNYPNPFNPSTTIKFAVPSLLFPNVSIGNPYVKISIFDVSGREVQTLVNETLKPGTYEAAFDGSKLPTGIYFYTLFADGNKIDTKKLVLIK